MPRKPKRPCSWPGCPKLVEGRFCEEHQKMENRRYEKYQRDPETAKRYGTAWQKIRAAYVSEHPLCEQCMEKGIYRRVEEVHHILPLKNGGNHNKSNLISLCHECHARLHAKRGDRWHRH